MDSGEIRNSHHKSEEDNQRQQCSLKRANVRLQELLRKLRTENDNFRQVVTLQDQLEYIYRSHRQGLFSLALSITGCSQLAEDAIQSAFEKLCRSAVTPDGDVVGYVFAAIRNSARDAVASRQRSNGLRQSIFEEAPSNSISHINPEDDVLTEERDRILRGAVQTLNDDAREIVVMKIFAGLTFDAISEVLDEPAKTVATRYRRAIIKLEEKLRGQL